MEAITSRNESSPSSRARANGSACERTSPTGEDRVVEQRLEQIVGRGLGLTGR
jgi:hypothetical protein